MIAENIQTKDRSDALTFLARFLDSNVPINAELKNLDGVYSIKVSEFSAICDDGDPPADHRVTLLSP